MQNMSGAAGGSGIGALAQALANQQNGTRFFPNNYYFAKIFCTANKIYNAFSYFYIQLKLT